MSKLTYRLFFISQDWKCHKEFCNMAKENGNPINHNSTTVIQSDKDSTSRTMNDDTSNQATTSDRNSDEQGQNCQGGAKRSGSRNSVPHTSTEAHRVRENNTITPKQRLINYCELEYVIHLGQGDIVPEERAGIDTPYAYWGIPSCGGSSGVYLRCNHFRSEDFTWLADNAELVQGHFEEVSEMGSHMGWSRIIDVLKNDITIDSTSNDKNKNRRRNRRNLEIAYPNFFGGANM